MKSIMEEASSIAKAVENGWVRAGKPQEFTVKVFEESEKNFIGMTKKPAKIALFFQEHHVPASKNQQTKDRYSSSSKPQEAVARNHKEKTPSRQSPQLSPHKATAQESLLRQLPRSEPRGERDNEQTRTEKSQTQTDKLLVKRDHLSTSPWNSELVDSVKEWVKDSIKVTGADVSFTVEVDRYALKLLFSNLVTESSDKEKILFRSWAYLIMQALRQKYKRPLKGLKIILMSNA